jgi:prepilin-type processing-associated H-X9-DG protein
VVRDNGGAESFGAECFERLIFKKGYIMVRASSRSRAAFSLVEALIAIAIIGVLVALIVPAVMQARVSAARTQCRNNLRQMTLAVQNYVSVHEGFPPLLSYSGGWKNGTPTGSMSYWTAYVLPYLGQQNLSDNYDFSVPFFSNTEVITAPLNVFQCPAVGQPGRTSTTTNWKPSTAFANPALAPIDMFLTCPSVTMSAGDYASYDKVSDDWKLYLDYPSGTPTLVGVLAAPPYPSVAEVTKLLSGGSLPLRAVQTRPAAVTDGLSNTIMIVECGARPQKWKNNQPVGAPDTVRGAGWADPAGLFTVNGDVSTVCLINCTNDANIYSFHPGGANFAFADGSARFLSTSINPQTLVALLSASAGDTPRGDW